MYEGHEDPTHKEAGYIQLRVNQPAGEGPHFQLQEARTSLRTKAAAYVCLGLGLDLGVWMELGHGDWAGSAVGCGLARLWKNRSGGDEKSRLPLCCRRAGRDLGHLNQLSWRLSRWHLWATAACSNLQLADRRDTVSVTLRTGQRHQDRGGDEAGAGYSLNFIILVDEQKLVDPQRLACLSRRFIALLAYGNGRGEAPSAPSRRRF